MTESNTAQKTVSLEGNHRNDEHNNSIKATASQPHSSSHGAGLAKAAQQKEKEKRLDKIRNSPAGNPATQPATDVPINDNVTSSSSSSVPNSVPPLNNSSMNNDPLTSTSGVSSGIPENAPLLNNSSLVVSPVSPVDPNVSNITANNTTTTNNSGTSSMSDIMVDDIPVGKLKRHHRFNRVVVVSNSSTVEILAALNMKEDTIYGTKVLEELGCSILFFKNKILANQALAAAHSVGISMFAQTTKTDYRYSCGKDLTKENIIALVGGIGKNIVTLNISKNGDDQFWAINTHLELSAKLVSKFRLTVVRTDIMVFRFAFNAKDNKVKKLASAISSQWKVAIIDTKVTNKVAYVSICKKDINTNVTQYVTVGNNKFKNLSFSAKVAKSLAYRLDNVEKEIIEIRTTLQKLVKSMAVFNSKKSDNLNNSKSVDKFNKAFKDVNRRIDLLSQPTARHVKGNGSKNGRRKSK